MTLQQKSAGMFVQWMHKHDAARDPILREGIYSREDMRTCWDASSARIRLEMQRKNVDDVNTSLHQDMALMAQVLTQWPGPSASHKERFEWQLLRGKAIAAMRRLGFIGEDDDGDN